MFGSKFAPSTWCLKLLAVAIAASATLAVAEEDIPKVGVHAKRLPYNDYHTFISPWYHSRQRDANDFMRESSTALIESTAEGNTDSDCDETTKNPVIIATGEKVKREPDFFAATPSGLALIRNYRSKNATGSLFGPNWLSSLDVPRLGFSLSGCIRFPNGDCVPQTVIVTDADGSKHTYTRGPYEEGHEHVYLGRDGTYLFFEYGQQWSVYRKGRIHVYFSDGLVKHISDPTGSNTLTFVHDAVGLKSVTTNAGHTVRFGWTNGRVTEVTDPDGKIWSYSYNGDRMLNKVTSPGGSDVREYHYEDADRTLLTGISINQVRYSTYKYYADKRVSESALAGREEVDKFVYGAGFTDVTDARNQTTRYSTVTSLTNKKIGTVTRHTTSTCAASNALTAYDANGFVDYTADWNGNTTDYVYDSTGRLQSLTRAVGPTALSTSYTWDGDKLKTETHRGSDTASFRDVVYTYYASGHPAAELVQSVVTTDKTTGVSHRTEYDYSFHANKVMATMVVKRTLANGVAVTTTTFDSAGNKISYVNPLNHGESWSGHNGRGQPSTHIDANGSVTTFEYYPNGSLWTTTQSGSRVTTYAYNHDRQITSVTYPSGRVVSYDYTAAGRLEQIRNGLGEPVKTAVDVTGNSVRTSSERKVPGITGTTLAGTTGGEFSAMTQLDSLGRPYTASGNNNQRVDYRYDGNGNLRTRTDAAGRVTAYYYDAHNRLERVEAPDGGIVRREYWPDGMLKSITDPRLLKTTYSYNGFGSLTKISSPDTGDTSFAYDSGGQLERETRQDGKTITYTWDLLGRMRTRTSGTTTETFTYDEGSFGKGRLTRLNDVTGQTTYTFNEAGQLEAQANTINGKAYKTTWTYDSAGKLVGMTYPTGLTLIYSYDGFGRVSSIKTTGQLHN